MLPCVRVSEFIARVNVHQLNFSFVGGICLYTKLSEQPYVVTGPKERANVASEAMTNDAPEGSDVYGDFVAVTTCTPIKNMSNDIEAKTRVV
jgi:hypothetical protein